MIAAIDARALGLAVISLGGGRRQPSDAIDHAVGLTEVCGLGETVGPDEPFALVHARTEEGAEEAVERIRQAVTLASTPPPCAPVVIETIGG